MPATAPDVRFKRDEARGGWARSTDAHDGDYDLSSAGEPMRAARSPCSSPHGIGYVVGLGVRDADVLKARLQRADEFARLRMDPALLTEELGWNTGL